MNMETTRVGEGSGTSAMETVANMPKTMDANVIALKTPEGMELSGIHAMDEAIYPPVCITDKFTDPKDELSGDEDSKDLLEAPATTIPPLDPFYIQAAAQDEEVGGLYGAGSMPTKRLGKHARVPRFISNKRLRTVVGRVEVVCCQMPQGWKDDMQASESLPFGEAVRLMMAVVDDGRYGPAKGDEEGPRPPRLCGQCLKNLSELIGLRVVEEGELRDRIKVICHYTKEGDRSFFRTMIHPDTRNWFALSPVSGLQCMERRICLGASKFAPRHGNDENEDIDLIQAYPCLRGLNTPDFKYGVLAGWLSEMFSTEEIKNMVIQEAPMYRHHHRNEMRTQDGRLRNMFFSLAQQAIHQCPLVLLAHLHARGGKRIRMISYPCSATLYEPGVVENFFYCSEKTKESKASGLQDEIILSGNDNSFLWFDVPFHIVDRKVERRRGRESCVVPDEALAPIRIKMEEAIEIKGKPGSMAIGRSGVITLHDFEIKDHRFSASSGLMAVNREGILENGAKIQEVIECHRRLQSPQIPRFGDQPEISLFGAQVALTGCGLLSDALVGRLEWSAPAVIRELDLWINWDPRIHSSWLKKFHANYKEAFVQVRELERELYGDRGFFAQQSSLVPDADLSADEVVLDAPFEMEAQFIREQSANSRKRFHTPKKRAFSDNDSLPEMIDGTELVSPLKAKWEGKEVLRPHRVG
ncbi:hypothetical protein BJ875DRAFT_490269 [Amylocarpus encephaloides]|uniref:Uncharacterized protein n=1 Tax=Amylocarpus encephaloides TaxID=45428 RepID=A0A9P7Y625_9HELO|nr:hypothetical protein BJ875DRAFT_490269 [Amylocarpus encephaloides]